MAPRILFSAAGLVFFLCGNVLAASNLASASETKKHLSLEDVLKTRIQDPATPREGIEDIAAYYRLVSLMDQKSFDGFEGEVNAFRAAYSNSPFAAKSEFLRKLFLYNTKPWEDFLTNRFGASESFDFYNYLKGRGETNRLLEFIDARIVETGRANTFVPIIGEVATFYASASAKSFRELALSWTNQDRLFFYARLLYKADRYTEALPLIEALEKTGRYPETSYYLGVIHFEGFQYDKAEPYLKKYLDRPTENDQDSVSYARWIYLLSLEKLKKVDEAFALAGEYAPKYSDQRIYQILMRLAKYSFPAQYPAMRSNFLARFPDSWTAYLMQRDDALTSIEAGKTGEGLATLKKIYKWRQSDFRYLASVLSNTNQEEAFLKNENPFYDYFYFQPKYASYFPFEFSKREAFLKEQAALGLDILRLGKVSAVTNLSRFYAVPAEALKWKVVTNREPAFAVWAGIETNREALLDRLPEATLRRVKWLLALGEKELAENFLEKEKFENEAARFAALAALYDLGGDDVKRLRLQQFSTDSGRDVNFLPWEYLRRLYPLYRFEVVNYFCSLYNTPPSLALAVMREESRFNFRAVSAVGARGLMQIMDATGRGLFKGAGLERYKSMNLSDPVENIHLGIRYLGFLLRHFGGDEIQAVASYNGGEGNVDRWSKGTFTNRLHFALMIPYDETERYVQKVLASKWKYELFYPELKNQSAK